MIITSKYFIKMDEIDNIGFSKENNLLLFDFGLCVCVKRFSMESSAYQMTGNTGSLRYMAPEVALSMPYNEKVDMYSFCILFWEMATGKVPFQGATKKDFMRYVVREGVRPDIPYLWSKALRTMLTQGWDPDYRQRPSFHEILVILQELSGLSKSAAPTEYENGI